ncbi:TetR/AcrR family transcriptional regulator [Methylobacterium sp. HMF5984]|uniref:TetR/AcrR family transcriptional regulator n=1 Tax=unclassified Methylobacterium TaxID=2615210 RepID=UPI0011CC7B21|nr:TetR/AcrR family transcriptional regulator [Methylobacterium sp. WL6]TXN60354.1 TetR/AcrR family transcriptional regulator [Methylobacterium sp. WL6]
MDGDDSEGPPRRRRRHLPGAERERQIVEAATRFFAEQGFGGQTRELAARMGITHSAIFRYFPTKEALIERVYDRVFVARWNPDWGPMVRDRSHPLEARLVRFYQEYAARIFDYEWVRIFVFAGLRSVDITPRYLAILREALILPVCAELRVEFGLAPPEVLPFQEREIEAVWALHGKVFYIAVRKYVYNLPTPDDVGPILADDVLVFMRGAPTLFRAIHADAAALRGSAEPG